MRGALVLLFLLVVGWLGASALIVQAKSSLPAHLEQVYRAIP